MRMVFGHYPRAESDVRERGEQWKTPKKRREKGDVGRLVGRSQREESGGGAGEKGLELREERTGVTQYGRA